MGRSDKEKDDSPSSPQASLPDPCGPETRYQFILHDSKVFGGQSVLVHVGVHCWADDYGYGG